MNFKYILSFNIFIIFINIIDCRRNSDTHFGRGYRRPGHYSRSIRHGGRGRYANSDSYRTQRDNEHFNGRDYSSNFDNNQDEEEDDFERGRGGPEGTSFHNSYGKGEKGRDGQRGVNDVSFYNNYGAEDEDDFEKGRGEPKGTTFYSGFKKSDFGEGKPPVNNLGNQITEEPGRIEKTVDILSDAYETYAPVARILLGQPPSPFHRIKARVFRRVSKKLARHADIRVKERRAQRAESRRIADKKIAASQDGVSDHLGQLQNPPKGVELFSSYRGDDDYDDKHYK